jgi:hypothetical protein
LRLCVSDGTDPLKGKMQAAVFSRAFRNGT